MERQGMADETVTAGVEIRRVQAGEWAAYRQVRLAALAEAPYAFSSTLATEIGRPEQHWRDRIAAWPQFIAWVGGEPAGIAAGFAEPAADEADASAGAGRSGSWQLVSMWVRPQARGLGIADELVAAVTAYARADGARRLTLWVTDVNARAMAFYRRMGFRGTGRRQLVRPEEPDHWEQEQVLELG
jgi:ribosomal protein S18 acetylase RimI-like enzyme